MNLVPSFPHSAFVLALGLAALALLSGPSAADSSTRQVGESVVLAGSDAGSLVYRPVVRGSVTVRSTYRPGLPQTVVYQEGKDYEMDYAAGKIRRLPGSSIPDYSKNPLFGVKDFNHNDYPGFGNYREFVFVDYRSPERRRWPVQLSQAQLLPRTRQLLKRGEPLKIAAFGDSITAGGDATAPDLIFWERWAGALRKRHRRSEITAVNCATGGDTTVNGLARLEQKVLSIHPDLVLVGFGMNDQNKGSVPLDRFAANLGEIVDRIRKSTSAEVVLFSAFPPNPNWHWTSGRMGEYAEATRKVAADQGCAFADVYGNWTTVLDRKKPEDLLANNVNHPNDFGHWIYFQVLERLGL
jgi:lysophospholipase L1-like esterase